MNHIYLPYVQKDGIMDQAFRNKAHLFDTLKDGFIDGSVGNY